MNKNIKVQDKNAPKFTIADIASDMRELGAKEYRLVKKLSRAQRRIDRKYRKLVDEKDTCGRLVMLDNARIYRSALKLADTLRKADKALEKAQAVEDKANYNNAAKSRMELA